MSEFNTFIDVCVVRMSRTKIVKISFKRNQFFIQMRKESVISLLSVVCLLMFSLNVVYLHFVRKPIVNII